MYYRLYIYIKVFHKKMGILLNTHEYMVGPPLVVHYPFYNRTPADVTIYCWSFVLRPFRKKHRYTNTVWHNFEPFHLWYPSMIWRVALSLEAALLPVWFLTLISWARNHLLLTGEGPGTHHVPQANRRTGGILFTCELAHLPTCCAPALSICTWATGLVLSMGLAKSSPERCSIQYEGTAH